MYDFPANIKEMFCGQNDNDVPKTNSTDTEKVNRANINTYTYTHIVDTYIHI